MNERITKAVRGHMTQYGLNDDVTSLVEAWTSPSDDDGSARVNISVGYQQDGRRRETALMSLEGEDEALALAESRDRLATLLALGIGAMPKSLRPTVPGWIADDAGAKRTRSSLARASFMANDESRGRRGAEPDGGPPGDPF